MLKKKLPTQPAKPNIASKFKQQVQAPDPDDEEQEVQDTDIDDDEEPPKPKKAAAMTGAIGGGGKKKGGLTAAFDSVPASNNADDLPPGLYEAIIRSIVIQEPDAKGQSIRVAFDLCDPDLVEGGKNSVTTWFKILDAEGDRVEGGIRAFKTTLAKLGYEPSGEELEAVCEEITEEKPGVRLKISYSKDNAGNTWQRAVVDTTCNNDVVQEYKDNVPY